MASRRGRAGRKGTVRGERRRAKIVELEATTACRPVSFCVSDGAILYATRDIAAALYRKQTYDFYKCLYVVAYQQNLHFKQLFKVLELMGKEWAKDLVHVAYGMVSFGRGRRCPPARATSCILEDVIEKCIQKAYEIISTKRIPTLSDKAEIAGKVGVGAVIFGALYNNKIKDITFSYDKVLNFEGETSVYVQYTCARANSVLSKRRGSKRVRGERYLSAGIRARQKDIGISRTSFRRAGKIRAQPDRALRGGSGADLQQILFRLQDLGRGRERTKISVLRSRVRRCKR